MRFTRLLILGWTLLLSGAVWAQDIKSSLGPQSDPAAALKLLMVCDPGLRECVEPFVMQADKRATPDINSVSLSAKGCTPVPPPGTPTPTFGPGATPTRSSSAQFCVVCNPADSTDLDFVYAGTRDMACSGGAVPRGVALRRGSCSPAWPAIDGTCGEYRVLSVTGATPAVGQFIRK